MSCDNCPRNDAQAETIKRQWCEIARLKRRVAVQQWIIDRERDKTAPLSPQEMAEQILQELSNGTSI